MRFAAMLNVFRLALRRGRAAGLVAGACAAAGAALATPDVTSDVTSDRAIDRTIDGAPAPTVAADERLIDRCNAAATEELLAAATVAACSEAYERLLRHYGGYEAYVAARRDREAALR